MRKIFTKYDHIPNTILVHEYTDLVPEVIAENSVWDMVTNYKTVAYRGVRVTPALEGCSWVDYEREK